MNISAVRSHVPLMDRLVQADLASVQILEGAITLEIDLAQDASGQLKELYDKFLESRAKLMDEARRSHKWGWLQKLSALFSRLPRFLQAQRRSPLAQALGLASYW
jgi:hypothetical protein